MEKGYQYLRFGTMSVIGSAGMILFREQLFTISVLLFSVASLLFLVVLISPSSPPATHERLRRRIP